MSAEARRVSVGQDADAQEAQLGASKDRPRSPDQPDRGYDVHSRYRPQPARALDRAYSRRPRQRLAGCSLPRCSRNARCFGCCQS